MNLLFFRRNWKQSNQLSPPRAMSSITRSLSVIFFITLIVQIIQAEEHQFEPQNVGLRVNFAGDLAAKLSNISDQANVWVLLPSSVNVTNFQFDGGEYSLLKLDARPLAYGTQRFEDPTEIERSEIYEQDAGHRGARKINFFKNVLNKPKVSPLYLVNGTVCRFVNSQPICTTLSTTGLIRGPNQPGMNQQQPGGQFGQQQQQQQQLQQGQQQQNTNLQQGARQIPFNQQSGFNQQFNPQQQQQGGNFQQFRPAALVNDETSDINVDATNGTATEGSTKTVSGRNQQQANKVQTTTVQATRPVNFVVRRPLNLLAFGRPFRQHQVTSRRGQTGVS